MQDGGTGGGGRGKWNYQPLLSLMSSVMIVLLKFFPLVPSGKPLFDKVGDWHFDKREFDPIPLPRNLSYPAKNVHFDLGRELIRWAVARLMNLHHQSLSDPGSQRLCPSVRFRRRPEATPRAPQVDQRGHRHDAVLGPVPRDTGGQRRPGLRRGGPRAAGGLSGTAADGEAVLGGHSVPAGRSGLIS